MPTSWCRCFLSWGPFSGGFRLWQVDFWNYWEVWSWRASLWIKRGLLCMCEHEGNVRGLDCLFFRFHCNWFCFTAHFPSWPVRTWRVKTTSHPFHFLALNCIVFFISFKVGTQRNGFHYDIFIHVEHCMLLMFTLWFFFLSLHTHTPHTVLNSLVKYFYYFWELHT